jgi:hypothetical protein
MKTNKLLMAVTAVALIAATSGVFAQQEPPGSAPAEKLAPKTPTIARGRDANLTFDTSPDNRARLREIFGKNRSAHKVDHVRFSLSVGTVVPTSIRLVALPQTIVDIQPTWHGDEYFRVGNQILIVDPQSKEIVASLAI